MAVKARDQVTVAVAVDVASVDNYYKLQSSTATPPTKPTTANPSGWSTTEPTYDGTSTNTLYICQKTTLTDGTFYWSAVSKSTSYEAAKTAYNLANSTSEALDDKADKTDGVEYISGTQVAATGTWTGVTKDSSLYDGKAIVYHLPVAGSGDASLVLTLSGGTDTDAIPIYHYYSTSSNTSTIQRVTTHYPAGSSVLMSYDATNVRWLISNYNTNVNQIDRTQHSNNLHSASANNTGKTHVVTASSVIGYVDTLSGYQTIVVGSIINLSKPILWGTGNVSVNKTFTNAYEAYPGCTLRNNVASWTGTQYGTAYLRGTVSGQNMTVESITSTIPSVEDGYVYLPLGELYSTYQIAFRSSSKLYVYKDGAFGPTSIREAAAAAKTATNYISLHPTDGIKIANANPATATTYQHQTATSTEFVVEGASMLEMDGTNGVRVGDVSGAHVLVDSDSTDIYDGANRAAGFSASFEEDADAGTSAAYATIEVGSDPNVALSSTRQDWGEGDTEAHISIHALADGADVESAVKASSYAETQTHLKGNSSATPHGDGGTYEYVSYNSSVTLAGQALIIDDQYSAGTRKYYYSMTDVASLLEKMLTPSTADWALATGVTSATTHGCRTNGVTLTIYGQNITLKSSLAVGSQVTIGTIPEGFRPPMPLHVPALSYQANVAGAIVQSTTSGDLILANRSAAAIATSTRIAFSMTVTP